MNIKGFVLSSGRLCGGVAGLVFLVVVLSIFPVLAKILLFGVLPVAIALVGGVSGLVFLGKRYRDLWVALDKFLGSSFYWLMGVVGAGSFGVALIALEWGVFASSLKVMHGQPVDDLGTVIPIGPLAVVALHCALIVVVYCVSRHLIFPSLAADVGKKWQRVVLGVVMTVIAHAFAIFLIGGVILFAYHDDVVQTRSDLNESLVRHKAAITEIEGRLQKLNTRP